MLDWILLDDDDFRVTLGFAGMGAVTVTLKQQNLKVKALPDEKASLDAAFTQLESTGVSVKNGGTQTKQVVRDFATRVARRVNKHTPTGLSPGQSMMFIGTSAMMLVAHAGGGITPNQFNMLFELVTAKDSQDKYSWSEALADQYKMVTTASPDSMTALIAGGRELSLEARREILISCIAISLLNGEPNKDQKALLDYFFSWIEVPLEEKGPLRRLAEQQAASFSQTG